MTTTESDIGDRALRLPGAFNVRDLGGLPVRGGGRVRPGMLLRSGELSGLVAAGAAVLGELGLRTVLDLRTGDEVAARPDALKHAGTARATLHTIPLLPLDYDEIPPGQHDLYMYMADYCGAETALVVKALAAPGALPGLFHCAVGKDRTGFVAGVVLDVIGVPDEEIIADFLLSNPGLGLPRPAAEFDVAARHIAGVTQTHSVLLSSRNAVGPELLAEALGRIRSRYGTVADYLRAGGVTDQELDSLKTALVEFG
jgi:protein-tyrosine phosphatase